MKAILRTGLATAIVGVGLAAGQARDGNAGDHNVGRDATAQETQKSQTHPAEVEGSDSQKLPPNTPKWNPGFGEQIPNKELSGNTPSTNSTLQSDRHGNMGKEYFGWLGLLGLAGLFGLGRGTNPSPRPDVREERTLGHLG